MDNTPNLRAALAAMISDYRAGEIPTLDAAHVDRWVSQFPAAVRDPILSELLHVFGWTYFSQAKVQTFIDSIVVNAKFAGANPCEFWQGVNVLSLQTAGHSQKDMLTLLGDSLQRQCGLAMGLCGASPHTYLYLDDAVFSGGRVRSDIIKWIRESEPTNAKLDVVVIGLHSEWYSTKMIREAATAVGKSIELKWWRAVSFENRKSEINNSDVMCPTSIPSDNATKAYVASLEKTPPMRAVGGKSPIGIFSGETGRHLLE